MITPSFSIIIPHYDIPDLLMRCLKSIPVSEDIQVIVVDDNSPEADAYLERYPELSRPYLEFIRTTKGGGAGYARNVGLDHSKGKWLLFADADDFYVENMYEIIMSHVDNKSDVIYFKKRSVLSEDVTRQVSRSDYINCLIDRYFEAYDEKPIRANFIVPWSKMIRAEIVRETGIRFDELQYANDHYFNAFIGCHAKTIEVSSEVLYVVTLRQGSLTSSFCKKKGELEIRAEVCFRVTKLLRQHDNLDLFVSNMPFRRYMQLLLRSNRKLFSYYFHRIDSIYPSRRAALIDIGENTSLKFKLFLFFYSLLLWIRPSIS